MAGLIADDRRMMERLRVRAVQRVQAGEGVGDVAAAMGVDRSNVYKWIKVYNAGGLDALRGKKAPGPKPKLNLTQVGKLRALILGADPRQLRFQFALWTREMVAELITREFGVQLSVSAVGRLLRSIGLSPQRPLWRAYQSDPDAIEAWKTTEFPLIRAEAAKAGGIVLFGDEAAVRSDYHGGTTWGEVGHTPVVTTTGARYRVNMISAVSAQGKLHFMLVEGKVDAGVFIDYCRRLLADHPGRTVFLIVDGHPAHRATRTKEWVASTDGRFRLFYLPSYSPQLNPDEWVWKNVKHDRVGKAGITSFDDLRHKAMAALRRLAEAPDIVRAFFRDPDLAYILK